MKAKDLAEILMRNPEHEVVHYQYNGGDTPLLNINNTHVETKGRKSVAMDGGHFINKNGIVEKDIIILSYDPNL